MKPITRCHWAESTPLMQEYHDKEWGVPFHDDKKHFEFLILEAAQAGLSWATVLKRREGYRKAFADFDPQKVARFPQTKVETLMQNPEIIRNRLKIESVLVNAKLFLKVQEEFGTFDHYVWQFVGGKTITNRWTPKQRLPATSKESDAWSKDLKKRGFKFVGSTVLYAHLQAAGLINDHFTNCFRYKAVQKKR